MGAPAPRVVFRRDNNGVPNLSEGSPQFLLADTAWAGLVRSTLPDWRDYLHHRVQQGFKTLGKKAGG